MKIIDTALIGLGNVNRNFLKILESKADRLENEYRLGFRIVAVADRSGVAIEPGGFEIGALRRHKEVGGKVADFPALARFGSLPEALDRIDCGLVIEASPVNLTTGEPGLSAVRAALGRGIACVLANKGPMVLAFHELRQLAERHGAGLAFSATVCGSLPVLNIGRRDLVAADIGRLSGIFNGTTNYILGEMEKGRSYGDGLVEAQKAGIAETDPTLDVEGWDTANKLVIIANSFLGLTVGLGDVAVEGITGVAGHQLQAELSRGNTIKLIATATRTKTGYRLTVAPTVVSKAAFLGRCDGFEMGVEIESDLYGIHYYKNLEGDALPTAAAILRDAVHLCSGSTGR